MALADVTIALTPTFNAPTALISLLDGSDFIAQGVSLVNVVGECTIRYPDGHIQQYGSVSGTPLWDYDTSLTSDPAVPIALYKDANGLFLKGTYEFSVTILDTSTGATITQVLTFEYCATAPVPDVDLTFSCSTGPLVQATDLTPYQPPGETPWTITSRVITLYGPQGTSWVTGGSTEGILTSSTDSAWTGAYEAKLVVTVTRTVNGVVETYSMTETFKGQYECLQACEVVCLLNKAHARTLTSKVYEKYEDEYQQVSARAEHIAQALNCGESEKVAELIGEIKNIMNVTDNCDCCGDNQPTYITPLTGGGVSLTLTGGSYITITGTSPNYNVAVDSTATAILNNTYNTVPVAGARMGITGPVVTAGNPPIHTYTFTPDVQEPDLVEVEFTLNFSGTGIPNTAAFTAFNEANYGSAFTAFSAWTKTMLAGATSDPAEFELSGYLSSPAGNDQVIRSAEVTGVDLTARGLPFYPKAEVFYQDRGSFSYNSRISISWPWGGPMSIDDIRALKIGSIYIRVGLTIK